MERGRKRMLRPISSGNDLVETREWTPVTGPVYTVLYLFLTDFSQRRRAIRAERQGAPLGRHLLLGEALSQSHVLAPSGRLALKTLKLVSLDKALLSGNRITSYHPNTTNP